MAKTPEAKVKAKVVAILKEAGAWYFFPVTGGFGKSGVFDIWCVYNGHAIGIEVKAIGIKRPTGLQSRNARFAAQAGASVLLLHANNLEYLRTFLEGLQHVSTFKSCRATVWPFDSVETCGGSASSLVM